MNSKTPKIICYFDLFIFLLLMEHCQREKIKKCLSLKKYNRLMQFPISCIKIAKISNPWARNSILNLRVYRFLRDL